MLRFLLVLALAAVLVAAALLLRRLLAAAHSARAFRGASLAALAGGLLAAALTVRWPGVDPFAAGLLGGAAAFAVALGTLIAVRRGGHALAPALPPEPAADRAVTAAWEALRRAARRAAPRIDRARDSCALVLVAAEPAGTEFALLEWAVFIRKRVPELADIGLADWRAAPPGDRPARLEALIVSLERIGEEAARRLSAAPAPDAQQIATLHAHIEARTRRS